MNQREFFKLAVRIRHHQTLYFATRDNNVKRQSIQLEQAMDAEIIQSCVRDSEMEAFVREEYPELRKRIDEYKYKQAQPDLFGDANKQQIQT